MLIDTAKDKMRRQYAAIGSSLAQDALETDNVQALQSEEERLRKIRHAALHERHPKALERLKRLGRLSVEERFKRLFDAGSEVLPLMSLARGSDNYDSRSAGVYVAIGQVHGLYCVVVANDNGQAAGAWFARTPNKITRAQKIALKLRVPIIYLVECSGLFLPLAHEAFAGADGGGSIFKLQAQLMHEGVVQLAAVFGDCIAGGGYMPIMTDYVIMTEAANMLIGGSAIAKGAKGIDLDQARIAGPNVHVHISHCADERAPDDNAAILMLREKIDALGQGNANFYRNDAQKPAFSSDEVYAILAKSSSAAWDLRELLARWVDASLVSELWHGFGEEIFACVGAVGGLDLVFIGNSGRILQNTQGQILSGALLYKDGIKKMQRIVRACAEDGIPIVWLQDVAGFDLGKGAEADGLLGLGANLLYENSNNPAPQMTIILRKASGAGYYAMGGLPFEPVMQLSTVLAEETVMSPETLANAVYAKKRELLSKDAAKNASALREINAAQEELLELARREASPLRNAELLYSDELVCLTEIPLYLRAFAEMSYQGYRKRRPRRLWRLNDEF